MSGLDLIYEDLSLTITRFGPATWPRTVIEFPEISRSFSGTPVERGLSFLPPHVWQITAILSDVSTPTTLSELDILEAIYQRYLEFSGDIRVHDRTRDFKEKTTRTRAVATGGTVKTVGTTLTYPAQFNARFSEGLEPGRRTKKGTEVDCTFQLTETTVVSA